MTFTITTFTNPYMTHYNPELDLATELYFAINYG
jgi:hypothetical protein